jgi:DNA-binding Xre family transcriptional regulator
MALSAAMSVVRINIKEAATNSGVENPFQLASASGISYALCYRLWHEQTTQISLPTLAKVCDALSCKPGDLLKLVQNEKKKGGKK